MNHHTSSSSRPRGRPRAHGAKPGWMLLRTLEILRVFQSIRDDGHKYEFAVRETLRLLRELYPAMRVSETEIKRVLASMYDPQHRVEWAVRSLPAVEGGSSHSLYERPCPRPPYRKPSKRRAVSKNEPT